MSEFSHATTSQIADTDPKRRTKRLKPTAGALAVVALLAGCATDSKSSQPAQRTQSSSSAAENPGAGSGNSAAQSFPNTNLPSPTRQSVEDKPTDTRGGSILTPTPQTYPEITDNRNGTPIFSSPSGGALPDGIPGVVPFNTPVDVECWAPNTSGMTSVNEFYKFQYGGSEVYGSANTFANGDPIGVPGGSHPYDPQVPECTPQQIASTQP